MAPSLFADFVHKGRATRSPETSKRYDGRLWPHVRHPWFGDPEKRSRMNRKSLRGARWGTRPHSKFCGVREATKGKCPPWPALVSGQFYLTWERKPFQSEKFPSHPLLGEDLGPGTCSFSRGPLQERVREPRGVLRSPPGVGRSPETLHRGGLAPCALRAPRVEGMGLPFPGEPPRRWSIKLQRP
ncbi:hypothetical protein GWK47_031272 [Chionoecetes opilio]|uniref:Uncharacterized protein n=1 Tax=Chionoecetes opilio TaxID=41210 RepID=A0A8J4YR84_CHIOP|nr:hypothetical protein GWK47_031272 [Chionoecetes opilio]